MNQDKKFISKWSEEVLNKTIEKMSSMRQPAFEDAVEIAVAEVLTEQKPIDSNERLQILASGAEVKDYMSNFTKETGMGPSFLVGFNRRR